MKYKIVLILIFVGVTFRSHAQNFLEQVLVVDMINNAQSNETNRDAEPNIAVDPENVNNIVATAFTFNPSGSINLAPIFISTDNGLNWALNNKIPSLDGRTHDIAVAFSNHNHTLYAGILQLSLTSMMTFRDSDPFLSGTNMVTLHDLSGSTRDQPFPEAISRDDGGVLKDNIFIGNNNLDVTKSASVEKSNDARTATPPAGSATSAVEVRSTLGQDGPPVRFSAHKNGKIYGAFVAWTLQLHSSGGVLSMQSDIVVIRDDNFGTGTNPFTALKDPSDNKAGLKVVQNVTTNFSSSAYLGKQRGALGISICVNPSNAADVWLAWLDSTNVTGKARLHVRRSTTSGVSWTNDLLAINDAINPSVAVNSAGVCGVLYQKLNGTIWETHIQRSSNGTVWSDMILSKFDNSNANVAASNPIGDYTDLVAVNNSFFGVFSALNIPDNSNFPRGVTYLRNADFNTHQLRNLANTNNITPSIDPYYFKISPRFISICDLHPLICKFKFIEKFIIKIPPYPCRTCPWPCIACSPFEIPIEDIYKQAYPQNNITTILANPYFHLSFEGYNPKDYDIKITTTGADVIKQEFNSTDKGSVISFHPSKNYFDKRNGIHGLVLTVLPKSAEIAKKGAEIRYNLKASDYHYNEFKMEQK